MVEPVFFGRVGVRAVGGWLYGGAEVVDTTHLIPEQTAPQIAEAVKI